MEASRSEIQLVRPVTLLERVCASLRALLRSVHVRRSERSLRLCETLPLGEKRLLAVVEFGRQRLLIAATSQSISLLDRADSNNSATRDSESISSHSSWDGMH